jgi:hypothetical protein
MRPRQKHENRKLKQLKTKTTENRIRTKGDST